VANGEPGFAERVRALFEARKHKTMATLRKDGSPRISGMELEFRDGEVQFGMMGDSLKAKDVLRDPRVAMHSPTVDPPEGDQRTWPGEAKISGRAVEQHGEAPEGTPPGALFFAIDIGEVVLTTLGDPADHLVIESWHPGRGLERRERS
jgi:hypothetical protein